MSCISEEERISIQASALPGVFAHGLSYHCQRITSKCGNYPPKKALIHGSGDSVCSCLCTLQVDFESWFRRIQGFIFLSSMEVSVRDVQYAQVQPQIVLVIGLPTIKCRKTIMTADVVPRSKLFGTGIKLRLSSFSADKNPNTKDLQLHHLVRPSLTVSKYRISFRGDHLTSVLAWYPGQFQHIDIWRT